MSNYTITVRRLCQSLAGLTEPETAKERAALIEKVRPLIFNFDYPIFDEAYRKPLETKIIRHYFLRELCTTPWCEWQLFLEDKINMIMPYYNQLYKSEQLAFNPLFTVDYSRKFNRNSGTKEDQNRTKNDTRDVVENGTTTQAIDNSNSVTMSGNTTTKESDTPQNNLYGVIEDKYLSGLQKSDTSTNTNDVGTSNSDTTASSTSKDTANSTENSVTNANTTEDYIESIVGKNTGESYSKLLMEFRESFLNIDSMLIAELNPLFFGLYGGDY